MPDEADKLLRLRTVVRSGLLLVCIVKCALCAECVWLMEESIPEKKKKGKSPARSQTRSIGHLPPKKRKKKFETCKNRLASLLRQQTRPDETEQQTARYMQ